MEVEKMMTPAIKKLLLATETRTALMDQACPRIRTEEERKKLLPMIAEIQETIDGIIANIRALAGGRFKQYADAEISCLCHVWASIWTEDRELMVNSQSFANVIGKNKPEDLGLFVAHLLDGTSPLLEHISLRWHPLEEGLGLYRIKILDPGKLTKLMLEKGNEAKEG